MSKKKVRKPDPDIWVCQWCGSDDIYEAAYVPMNMESNVTLKWDYIKWPMHEHYISDCCNDFERPVTEFEWHEIVFEECHGNKHEIEKIIEGSRM